MTNYFQQLNGKSVEILSLCIFIENETTNIDIRLKSDAAIYNVKFINISDLNLKDFSYPNQIAGFEIICNSDKGWEDSSRYTVNDFEDGKIRFYCENVIFAIY